MQLTDNIVVANQLSLWMMVYVCERLLKKKERWFLLVQCRWLEGMKTLTCEKLRVKEGWRCKEREGSERERDRELETLIICVTNVAHVRWGEVGWVAINTLPQPSVHFNLHWDILKSEPWDEGHLPQEDFFPASLFFYTSFSDRRLV